MKTHRQREEGHITSEAEIVLMEMQAKHAHILYLFTALLSVYPHCSARKVFLYRPLHFYTITDEIILVVGLNLNPKPRTGDYFINIMAVIK